MTDNQDDLHRQVGQLLPRLRRFGAALAGTQDDGDDIVQGAIARALSRSEQWLPGTRLDSWLFKIMENLWRDELRKRKNNDTKSTMSVAGEDKSLDGRQVAETLVMLAETRARFARLPDEQRIALALVVIEGLSYREAADQLEIPIGTLMSRLSRARESLRAMIEEKKPMARTAAGE